MELWVYDEATASLVIKLKKNQYRIVDPKDLLNFGEHDIQTLSNFQIIVEIKLFEAIAKAFTSMLATIIYKKLWERAFDQADIHLVEKPWREQKEINQGEIVGIYFVVYALFWMYYMVLGGLSVFSVGPLCLGFRLSVLYI